MSEPKWGKEKALLFWATIIFAIVGMPLLIVLYVFHKLSQIH